MKTSIVARRYASALLEATEEAKKTDKVQKDLVALANAWNASPELRALFEDPRVTLEDRKKVLEGLGKRVLASPLAINTLKLMADNGRLSVLPDLSTAFNGLARSAGGEVEVEVTTAKPMPATFYTKLSATLSESTGKKVTLIKREDPSIIGGVVTRVQDKVYDGSLRNGLSQLRERLLA